MRFLRRKVFYYLNFFQFKYLSKSAYIDRPLRLDGKGNIVVNSKVFIKQGTWLAAVGNKGESCVLEVGEGTVIGNFNHIYSTGSIVIGKNVLTADKVYIGDNLHSFEDISVPIINQPIKQLSSVHIGDGSWLGEHVCIIGASVGRNSVIGANSVVTSDIPDYCIAVGSPARVVKKYNHDLGIWERV